MSAVTTVPAAGWYEDDMVPGRERWWDGDRWSDRVRRSEFGLDCWVSEQHRARVGVGAVTLPDGGARWTEASSVDVATPAYDGERPGLTVELGTAATWALLGDASGAFGEDGGLADSEIGPVQVTVVADRADGARTPVATEPGRVPSSAGGRNATRKPGGKKKSNRRPSEVAARAAATPAARLYDQDEDAASVGDQQVGTSGHATVEAVATTELVVTTEPVDVTTEPTTESGVDADPWGVARHASTDDTSNWSATGDTRPAAGATADAWAGTSAASPARDEAVRRPTAQPLADAAAVIAALAAMSAPVGHGPTTGSTGGSGERRPASLTSATSAASAKAAGEATCGPALARSLDEPAASATATADTVATSSEPLAADADASSDAPTSRRRGVPPRPTLASAAESGDGPTSHTFTRIDRKTLDAAMALSAVVGPTPAVRAASRSTPDPGPVSRPTRTPTTAAASPPAPVAPTEPAKAASPRAPRPARSNRPAPPLPRWSDDQAADDEADTGFVRISARDGKKRVLGK